MNYNDQQQAQYAPPANHPPQPAVPEVQPNTATFIADKEVLDIIRTVHPEMASAMINIAIKKFSTSSDFTNYFVMPAYKEQAQLSQENVQSTSTASSVPEPAQAVPDNAASFSNW